MDEQRGISEDLVFSEEKGSSKQKIHVPDSAKKPVYKERSSADQSLTTLDLKDIDVGTFYDGAGQINSPKKKALSNKKSPAKKSFVRANLSPKSNIEAGTSNSEKSDISSPAKKVLSRKRVPARKADSLSDALPKDLLDYPRLEPYKVLLRIQHPSKCTMKMLKITAQVT